MYQVGSNNDREGARWIDDPGVIAKHYLRTWFFIDLISVIPFQIIGFYQQGSSGGLRLLKIVRLLRLIKLVRLVRVSRLFRRWESQIAISYSSRALIR